jgi:hypothetical protein
LRSAAVRRWASAEKPTIRLAASAIALIALLPGLASRVPAQQTPTAPEDLRRIPSVADAFPIQPAIPIHTLPNGDSSNFAFPTPRDYQPAGIAASSHQQAIPSGPEALPTPTEALPAPNEINWDDASIVDLEAGNVAEALECSPFGPCFYRGSGRLAASQWLIGSGDRLGIFTQPILEDTEASLGWFNYKFGAVIHFISGPVVTDLPPRVYDLSIAIPRQGSFGEHWSYDLLFRAGWFTDFEGSARNGLRFPSHAVLYRRISDQWQWLIGIDYLDREDITLLPVLGALWTPCDNWRVEAVFPKPLIAYRWQGVRWVYVAAEMGGGTWDIERSWHADDVFTYRDFSIVLGIDGDPDEQGQCIEVGYVFDRHLEYRSGSPDYRPPDTIVLRGVARY